MARDVRRARALRSTPAGPASTEAHQRIKEALPYLKYVHNTSISWGIRLILEDLYGWKEPLDAR